MKTIDYLKNDFEKIEYFINLLISYSTGGTASDNEYIDLRNYFLRSSKLKDSMPSWVRVNKNLKTYWEFIKYEFPTYAERRKFLRNEFREIQNSLEFEESIPTPKIEKQKTKITSDQDVKTKVFIVHGRDNETKLEVARFLEKIGLEAIILHEQASTGMTIIEKIEHYVKEAHYGIVLYTPCDQGRGHHEKGKTRAKDRARQNVVFEHGYLMAKLGRENVHALVKGEIETPNDISGLVYSSLNNGHWQQAVCTELKACGYKIDMDNL
ncbi:MAG: nucleotide-binding protein [Psychrilyobacter sp.]|uniref:TIR domain-containing protein n=1 Tax=Psychrilyobacter sp. TaxID=2586924 RepID=UPI003C775062